METVVEEGEGEEWSEEEERQGDRNEVGARG